MASQYGIKYAVHIITEHFGNLVAQVCECLLRKGPLALLNVARFTGLSHVQVKNSLLVLIQHNCVQAFVLEEEGGPQGASKFTTQYMALFSNIIYRKRFPKFLALVKQEFDKPCGEILWGLLEHGRLTLNEIYDASKATPVQGNSSGLNVAHEYLQKLVVARYVERCPSPEPVLALPNVDEAPAKKRGAKSSKIIVEPETLEQRVIAAAVPMDAKRFSLLMDTKSAADEETTNKSESPRSHAGDKRKHDSLDSNTDDGVTDQVVLWRVNFEEFIRRLRYKACIETVRSQMDDGAAIVFSATLEASSKEEKKVKIRNSVPVALNDIYEEVIKSEKGRNMTIDHTRAALLQLSSPPFVRMVGEFYSIDFKYIIEVARSDEVESIVLNRHGRDAYKMFRLLSKSGHLLETDKISNATFVESKEAPKVLYKLWQDEYLLMEKIVAGPATFLLWKVNKPTVWAHALDEMFHAALNLSIRLNYEMEQGKQVLDLPAHRREGEHKEKFDKLHKVRNLLAGSLLKIDNAIMLFHDF